MTVASQFVPKSRIATKNGPSGFCASLISVRLRERGDERQRREDVADAEPETEKSVARGTIRAGSRDSSA